MNTKLIKLLPLLLLLSCGNNNNKGEATTTADTTAATTDSLKAGECEMADVDDTTQECFQLAPKDILRLKEMIGDDVIASSYKWIEFKLEKDRTCTIERNGGCGDINAFQSVIIKVVGLTNEQLNDFEYLKKMFAAIDKKYTFNIIDEIPEFLKSDFLFETDMNTWVSQGYRDEDDDIATYSEFSIEIGETNDGKNFAKLVYQWNG